MALAPNAVGAYAQVASASGAPGGSAGASGGAGGDATIPPTARKLRAAAPDKPVEPVAREAAQLQGATALPLFLQDKPLDVEIFTPCILAHQQAVEKALSSISELSRELLKFSGDLADLSSADFETAEAGEVLTDGDESMHPDYDGLRASLFAKLDACRIAIKEMRETEVRMRRLYWLANFTYGCNWETVLQLIHREKHDANGGKLNPDQKALSSWDEKVKAAIIGANQQKASLSKDGKSLIGPIHPRLQPLHSKAALDRMAQAGTGAPIRSAATQGGTVGPPNSSYGRGHPVWRGGGRGGHAGRGRGRWFASRANKENSQPNQAGQGAPAKGKGKDK